jgi:transposase
VIRPSGDVRIHLYRQPVDMRKAINGLVSIVEGDMDADPFSADLYIFCNRARTLVKPQATSAEEIEALLAAPNDGEDSAQVS